MATQAQVREFIERIAPIAQSLCRTREKWILPSITIAQAACESNWGTSKPMAAANGLFGFKVGTGVKYGTAWKGKSYNTKTKEFYGEYVTIRDNFRAYDTVEESVEDYMDLLCSLSRYKGAVNQTDPRTCITAIKNGGYATSPSYINTIMSIVNKNNLTQYDSVVTGNAGQGIWQNGSQEAIKTYSLKEDGNKSVSANFKVKEFRCKDGTDKILIDEIFVKESLQKIRDHFRAPVVINSAYRTAAYNKKVGGAGKSYHLTGQAFDIVVKGKTPAEVARYAQKLGIKGIIRYNSFVHVDSRDSMYWAINNNGKAIKVDSF